MWVSNCQYRVVYNNQHSSMLFQPTLSEMTNGKLFVDKWPMPVLGRGTCDTEKWASITGLYICLLSPNARLGFFDR